MLSQLSARRSPKNLPLLIARRRAVPPSNSDGLVPLVVTAMVPRASASTFNPSAIGSYLTRTMRRVSSVPPA